MRTFSIPDMYMPILSALSDDDKLDLIARLSETMRSRNRTKADKPDLRSCFSGDYPDKTSVALADELRSCRYFEDKHIAW